MIPVSDIKLPAFAEYPGIREALSIWHGWRGDKLYPCRAEAPFRDVSKFFEAMVLFEVKSPDEIMIRYFGTLLMDYYGQDFTGRNYIEVTPEDFKATRSQRLMGIVNQPCAAAWTTRALSYGAEQEFSAGISLPLAKKDGDPATQILQICLPHKGTERPVFKLQKDSYMHRSDQFRYVDIGAGVTPSPVEAGDF